MSRRSGLRCDRHGVDTSPVHAPRQGEIHEARHGFRVNLALAQEGSPRACQWLYESLAGRVAGYLRLHGARESEDLTSEVFLRVFDHLREFDGSETGFRAWVFTIAHRLLIDEHRRESRQPRTVELSVGVSEGVVGGDAEVDALAALDDRRIAAVLGGLRPEQREVIALRVVGDLTAEQAAQVLGKSRGAVKALQRRGIAALRRRLEEEGS
jgi:RNA polymerase sigma-70 factor (ECF subfamily)